MADSAGIQTHDIWSLDRCLNQLDHSGSQSSLMIIRDDEDILMGLTNKPNDNWHKHTPTSDIYMVVTLIPSSSPINELLKDKSYKIN